MLLGVKGRKERLTSRIITYVLRSQIKAFIVSSIDIIITGEGWSTTHINDKYLLPPAGIFSSPPIDVGDHNRQPSFFNIFVSFFSTSTGTQVCITCFSFLYEHSFQFNCSISVAWLTLSVLVFAVIVLSV